ncbi:hypothetical protein BKA67DRAFT_573406 [Truncatella angustata]|uniref:Uncharacterized protein n=1 Tax=Truncatella angustata TaxID=152316 RepID=A0A9P8ZWR5_9PEZI|nr:uncharacterized protein BKA67DRAFT_573406 [Truncatella angustata]KAH6652248.1 hypothetical protein BKA67DRAFT_573406 [Truncatella angustata]
MSRSKREDFWAQIHHILLDLSTKLGDMPRDMESLEADYLFFCNIPANESDEKNTRVNGKF